MFGALKRTWQNVRDLPGSLALSTWIAGFLIVIVGFTGSLVLTVPAAESAGLSAAQLSSWVMAITIGSGIATILLSIIYRQPVITAWSTPGLALLGTSLANYRLEEAIGAYIVVGLAIAALGVSGLFERTVRVIPQAVALAVLGGLLLNYGLALFTGITSDPLIVLTIIGVFLICRKINMRVPIAGALVAGFVMAFALGQLDLSNVQLAITPPLWVMPVFTPNAILGLGLPLFVLALASQNMPGFAVMRAAGYNPPVNGSLVVTGLISALLAPMLNHGITLAAITAAIGNSSEAHPDAQRRYATGIASGLIKIGLGLFGGTIITLLVALPRPVVAALAGLALFGAISNALSGSFADPDQREAGLWAFLTTASGVQFFGIGSAFWGLLVGVVIYFLLKPKAAKSS